MADRHFGQSNTDCSVEEKSAAPQEVARHTARSDGDAKPARFALRMPHLLIGLAGLILAVLLALWLWPREKEEREAPKETAAGVEGESNEVALTPEAIKTAGIEIGQVSERPAVARLSVAGAVEANAEREQTVVPLVAGRVATVTASLGQRVARGGVLATIESPQVAELAGELLEAKSKLSLTTANVERTRQAANRASVISAKAKLDLAEKNLSRQRRLLEIGAGSTKDVQAAEAEYSTAKAEYDYQSNVALSREVQTAESEREAVRVTVERLRQALIALGANPDQEGANASITVTAPITGKITRRAVNPGAGVKEGDTLFAIADLSTVWVMANVPEAQVSRLHVGARAEARPPSGGETTFSGHVNFIDSQVNAETHTVRVRMEAPNSGERLKAGMFVEVSFPDALGDGAKGAMEVAIPSEAVQRIGERPAVFVPEENEPGHFKMRFVELGGEIDGYRRVTEGVKPGERIVVKGSFALKSQLLKGQLKEDDEK
ncbi:MAG: efflux RND transporter periplasmic adaptor subunit [Blastocatellia bacterium]|nr:efflux RND transporter periplasmic adaptor subunit [Blastocatellia bacterium]